MQAVLVIEGPARRGAGQAAIVRNGQPLRNTGISQSGRYNCRRTVRTLTASAGVTGQDAKMIYLK